MDGEKSVSKSVECEICTHEWVAVYPFGCKELECPNCENMTIVRCEGK
jgi:hypothetical protein